MFESWWTYAERRYLSLPERGHPDWIAFYYDPIIDHVHRGSPQFGLYVALYLAPQKPEVARRLLDWAADTYRWSAGDGAIRPVRDTRVYALGLVLANELGDTVSYARLREHVERTCEPRWDPERGEFTWGFGLGEPVPRGQLNGTIMMAEVGGAGAWSRIFKRPNLTRFAQPTVCDIDYPTVGVSRAWYDPDHRRLAIDTYAADGARRGAATSFRVTHVEHPTRTRVVRGGGAYDDWHVTGPAEITVESDVADREFLFVLGGG